MASKRSFESPRIVVNVSAETIEESTQRDSSHCMIAESVRDIRPNAKHISVDLQTIRFSDPDKRLRYNYLTPRKAQIAIVQFDQGRKPDPFQIVLSGAQVVSMADRNAATRHANPSDGPQPKKRGKKRLGKAEIVPRGGKGSGVQVIGGRSPPKMSVGRRRAFGIKGLEA